MPFSALYAIAKFPASLMDANAHGRSVSPSADCKPTDCFAPLPVITLGAAGSGAAFSAYFAQYWKRSYKSDCTCLPRRIFAARTPTMYVGSNGTRAGGVKLSSTKLKTIG